MRCGWHITHSRAWQLRWGANSSITMRQLLLSQRTMQGLELEALQARPTLSGQGSS